MQPGAIGSDRLDPLPQRNDDGATCADHRIVAAAAEHPRRLRPSAIPSELLRQLHVGEQFGCSPPLRATGHFQESTSDCSMWLGLLRDGQQGWDLPPLSGLSTELEIPLRSQRPNYAVQYVGIQNCIPCVACVRDAMMWCRFGGRLRVRLRPLTRAGISAKFGKSCFPHAAGSAAARQKYSCTKPVVNGRRLNVIRALGRHSKIAECRRRKH